MEVLMYAFFSTFLISIVIVWSNTFHGHLTNDIDFHSVQKFHLKPVSRIGGLALLMGLFVVWIVNIKVKQDTVLEWGWIIVASLPIVSVGILEDITKKVSARFRLYVSFFSAALVYFLIHIHFVRIDWPWFDQEILSLPPISFLMTLLVIGGTIHAMNLIDGFNGLMLGVSLIMFAAIAIVSYVVRDSVVLHLTLACFGITSGLFFINFPFGKIFAGDSGAYFIGFLLGTTVLMLVERNREVSAWFPCLVIIYPIVETLFSIYRKTVLRKMAAMKPDGVHFHMLVYRRITRRKPWRRKYMNNSMTSLYLCLLSLIGVVPAILFWDSTILTIIFCAVFSLCYLRAYWYLVYFKDKSHYMRNTKMTRTELMHNPKGFL